MRSLFARIWLSYWGVMAATLAAALAVSFAIAVKRSEDLDRLSPAALAPQVQALAARGGRDALSGWVMDQHHTHPELAVFFIDASGREVLGRPIHGAALPGAVGRLTPVIEVAGAGPYRMYVRRVQQLSFAPWQLVFQPWVLIGLAILVSGLGSAALAHQLTRPLVRLRAGVRSVAAGALETRMAPSITRQRDEVGGLARDIDQMTGRLQELIQSKEQLLQDISHELRSPLARLQVAAGLLRRQPDSSNDLLDRIDRDVDRLDDLIGRILEFSRAQAAPGAAVTRVDLAALLEDVVEDGRLEAEPHNASIILANNAEPCVEGDPRLIASAIENVLRNAIRHTPAGTPIQVSLRTAAGMARVRITDAGPGLSVEELAHARDPFVRGQGSCGVGLGLAITDRILKGHGGQLVLRNGPKGGLQADLLLPIAQAAATSTAGGPA